MAVRYTNSWAKRYKNYQATHTFVAEQILGKRLPVGAVVHHVDGNGENNAHSNLVICPSQEYHFLLHMRQEAYDACGDVNKRKCSYCKQYEDIDYLFFAAKKGRAGQYWHRACHNAHRRARYAKLGHR